MLTRKAAGCGCCGGGGGGIYCGLSCSACGGVYLLNGGPVTDANGVHPLSWGGGSWGTGILLGPTSQAIVMNPDPGDPFDASSYGDGYVHYYYTVNCLDGDLFFSMSCDPIVQVQGPLPDVTTKIAGYCVDPGGPGCPAGAVTLPVTAGSVGCSGGHITRTLTFSDAACPVSVPPPPTLPVAAFIATASVSIPIETAGAKVCCEPCPIPAQIITGTLSGPGGEISGGAIYDSGSQTWTTGCHSQTILSLACVSGITIACVKYFTSGGCPGGTSAQCCSSDATPAFTLVDYTCEPFHLHYAVTPGRCPVLDDNGITDFYWDV